MIQLKKIFTCIFLLHSVYGLACDCNPIKDHDQLIESSFKYYPQIFIGEIVERKNIFWIEVQEVFKGEIKIGQRLKTGFEGTSCSFYFGKEGPGLFYGYLYNNEFFADICSPTRTFKDPHLFPPPPPPTPDSDSNSDQEKERFKEYEKLEKKRLRYEIKKLRSKN